MLWLGLVASIAIVVGGLVIKRVVLLGFGATGIAVFAYQLIDAAFRGTLWAPVAMLVAGLVFVGLAVFVAVRLPQMSRKKEAALHRVAAAAAIAPGEAQSRRRWPRSQSPHQFRSRPRSSATWAGRSPWAQPSHS